MEKVDIYKLIHKAQRKYLFELSIKIGLIDYKESIKFQETNNDLNKIIEHLYKHSETEETYIHPLYESFLEDFRVQRIISEHKELEIMLHKLNDIIINCNYADLYSAFNKFIAHYLLHIDLEEEIQSEILWPNYDNEKLLEVMKKFNMSLSEEETLANYEFMMSSFSSNEAISLLSKTKASSTSSFYQKVYRIAERQCAPPIWNDVKKEISQEVV